MTGARAFGALACLVLLSACGDYDPPVRADHDSAKYRADLAACHQTGGKQADHQATAYFRDFVFYPVTLPIHQRQDITRCMTAKGYVLPG